MAKGKKSDASKADAPKADKVKGAAKRVAEQLREQVESAGSTMRDAAAAAAANTGKVNMAVIDQAEANTRAAFAAMRAAATAGSVTEIAKVQRDYVKEQGARSLEQVREIGDLIAQFGRDAMAQMTGRGRK